MDVLPKILSQPYVLFFPIFRDYYGLYRGGIVVNLCVNGKLSFIVNIYLAKMLHLFIVKVLNVIASDIYVCKTTEL